MDRQNGQDTELKKELAVKITAALRVNSSLRDEGTRAYMFA